MQTIDKAQRYSLVFRRYPQVRRGTAGRTDDPGIP